MQAKIFSVSVEGVIKLSHQTVASDAQNRLCAGDMLGKSALLELVGRDEV